MLALRSRQPHGWLAVLCTMALAGTWPPCLCSAGPAASQPAPATQPTTKPQWSARIVAELHGSSGQFVAFSKDQTAILTGGKDQVRVWDAKTFQPRVEPIKCPSFLRATGFIDGAKKVFTVAGKSARICDAKSGRELRTLSTDADMLSGGASPDSKWLITGGDDGMARIWDLATGQQRVERKHPGKVYFAAFLPTGSAVLTVPIGRIDPTFSDESAMYLWDPRTGHDIVHWKAVNWSFDPDDHHVPVAISHDQTKTAVAYWDAVIVQRMATGEVLTTVHSAGIRVLQWIHSLTFSPDGKILITCGATGAELWNTEQDEARLMLIGDGDPCGQAVFSPDGSVVLTSSEAEVAAYSLSTGEQLLSVHSASAKVNGFPVLAFSPDGRHFAVGFPHSDLTIVWEVKSP